MKDTKTAIVEAAFRLFLERGYEGASMSDLVAATGLSKGAVYHHFRDKDALHDAAIEHFFLRFFGGAETEVAPDAGLEQVLNELCAAYTRLLDEVSATVPDMAAYYRFLFAILPKVRAFIEGQIVGARNLVADAVRREQQAGRIGADHSPEVVADQCLALIEGGGLLCILEGKRDVREVFRRTLPPYIALLQTGRDS
ncbi:TetR/AcrR family transcriptional regulator [Aminobacter aminovorans]|uniref:TetR/AcrR family transcriptional regulator n=1 Tax=Aminobacter aminovorans TaxID=83263 RepID=UPI00285DB6A2|nr:TetR/AcrR family transcriptional regulator [Aminobacter aminovorans]MDR7220999.1 AcrR family transcriptional regulator [Aminobacter aminovorans]